MEERYSAPQTVGIMGLNTPFSTILVGLVVISTVAGCRAIVKASLPQSPLPPHYWSQIVLPEADPDDRMAFAERVEEQGEKHRAEVMSRAMDLSDRLEAHIRAWLDGEVSAKIPPHLLPPTIENEKTRGWTLCRPDEVKPEEQWYFRPAEEIPSDFSRLHFLSPDNHCTYGKLLFLAPFGSRLVIEGDFPHCRFFDLQITPPLDPDWPCAVIMGPPEVPIVDVDIEPDQGHTNPFRVGSQRNAAKRHYHVTFGLAAGNPVALNPAYVPPYRASGNTRVGSAISYSGAWGVGSFVPGVVWLRYYAPDHGRGPLAGVSVPKAILELPSGERFWLRCDFSLTAERQNTAVAGFPTEPKDPPCWIGSNQGWWKMFGIWLVIAEGYGYVLSQPWYIPTSPIKRFIRESDRKLHRRGPDQPPPGNYECSATCCNYIHYLVRPMMLGKGKVIVLTGKLPHTPRTRNGEVVMESSQCRYWSIARTANSPDRRYPSILYGCLMDDEIMLDQERCYVIVYSRKEDRPKNAVAKAGVTWQNWGPPAMQAMTIRWMSIVPEPDLSGVTPNEANLPWSRCTWSQKGYDEALVGRNDQSGFLGPYQPTIHYLTTEQFEALGSPIDPTAVPVWR